MAFIDENVDISSPQFKANPHGFYADLRAHRPVFEVKLQGGQKAWLITRYDDALAALKDKRFAKDRLNAGGKQPWLPSFFKPLSRNMLDLDEPHHARLRGLVHKAFTPKMVEAMRGNIEALASELLEEMSRKKQADLIADYALPIPITMISRMLGVPENEQHKFRRWSSIILATQPTGWRALLAVPPAISFLRYIRKMVRLRRENPQTDLTTSLVEAEEAGEHLDEDELVAMMFLLLIAGHETTVNLIGNGMLALLENPEQMERLRRDPPLIANAVEELLRFAGPLETATERYAVEDVNIAGTVIPQGAMVFVGLASANRDDRQFENPDRLDLSRENNRHLAFGQATHYCLGAPLARMEGQIAIDALLQRFPYLRLAVSASELRWKKGLVLRGLEKLPVIVR